MAILTGQELFKLFRRKKTLVVIIAFILLTTFLCYGIRQNSAMMEKYSTPEFQIENLESHISYLESEIDNIPDDIKANEEEVTNYQTNLRNEIEHLEGEIELLKKKMDRNLKWEDALAEDIKAQEDYIEASKSSMNSDNLSRNKMELDQLKYLQEHNIEPHSDYEFNGFTYLEDLLDQLGQVFLVIGISVFAADMVSGEWTPATMKLLLAQPVSRRKVLLSKFLATIAAAVGLILLIEIISFIVVGLLFEFGDMNYPVVINKVFEYDYSVFLEDGTHPLALVDGSWDIVPMWKYSLVSLAYQALFIVAASSFVFMVSTLAKSSMVSMGVSVVSLIAATIVFQFSTFHKIARYTFTTYASIGDTIAGNMAMYFSNPAFNLNSGIIAMVGGTIVCYIVSHFVFTKRDMLV